jgi:phospholipase/lecithinase/hemolysin
MAKGEYEPPKNARPATAAAKAAGARIAVVLTVAGAPGEFHLWCHGDTRGHRIVAKILADTIATAMDTETLPQHAQETLRLMTKGTNRDG